MKMKPKTGQYKMMKPGKDGPDAVMSNKVRQRDALTPGFTGDKLSKVKMGKNTKG